jgi:hypothetical protein
MVMQALRSDTQKVESEQQPSGDGEAASRLDAFPSESEGVKLITHTEPARHTAASAHDAGSRKPLYMIAAAVAFVAVLATAGVVWFRAPGGAATGSLRVETDTPGADVSIDGSPRGKTPLLLSLPVGDHSIRVQQGTLSRTLPVSIAEATTVVHHISWPADAATPPTTGSIEITSDPRGQSVTIDGEPRGVTPLTVTDLPPGEHEVIIRRDSAQVRRMVQIEAGATASLMLNSAGTPGVSSGWLSVAVPIPLQIYEGDRLVGSSESDRILVPTGNHTYEFVNTALGFRTSRTVQIGPGQTESVALTLPRGTINVNAVPWAEVWLDGQPLGETPIGNVSWTIGSHELVLRHPQFGERRVTATIATGDPARVAVDMRRAQ